ncbi:hypothetical protein FCV25MIE_28967, partial [Fagus crenata]
MHRHEFIDWFKEKITQYNDGNEQGDVHRAHCLGVQIKELITTLVIMSMSLDFVRSDAMLVKEHKNSGIMVRGEHQNGNVPFYELVIDIVELRYTKGNSIVLFKCEWID